MLPSLKRVAYREKLNLDQKVLSSNPTNGVSRTLKHDLVTKLLVSLGSNKVQHND